MDSKVVFSGGQSTIELLLVLSILLIILGLSISIFSNHRIVSAEKHVEFLAYRNAKLVGDAFVQASAGPIGGTFTLFLATSPQRQTLYVRNGFVDVESGQSRVLIPLPNRTWDAGPFYDGNIVTVVRDSNTVHAYAGG